MTIAKARAALRALRAVLLEKGLGHLMRAEFDWGDWGDADSPPGLIDTVQVSVSPNPPPPSLTDVNLGTPSAVTRKETVGTETKKGKTKSKTKTKRKKRGHSFSKTTDEL